jgi:hypothetical protein
MLHHKIKSAWRKKQKSVSSEEPIYFLSEKGRPGRNDWEKPQLVCPGKTSSEPSEMKDIPQWPMPLIIKPRA